MHADGGSDDDTIEGEGVRLGFLVVVCLAWCKGILNCGCRRKQDQSAFHVAVDAKGRENGHESLAL